MTDVMRPVARGSFEDVVAALRLPPPADAVAGLERPRSGSRRDRIRAHLAVLYETSIRALDMLHRGHGAEAARVLVAGGRLEEQAGRPGKARAWYEAARSIGEQLDDDRVQVEVMQALVQLEAAP